MKHISVHYVPDPLPNAPALVRKARCGKFYTRVGFDPKTHPRTHEDGTPFGLGCSNLRHVTCAACKSAARAGKSGE